MQVKRIRDHILITEIPLPPSINQMYSGQSRRYASKKYRDWQNECNQHYLEMAHQFRAMRVLLEKILDDYDAMLEVKFYLFLHYGILYRKDGYPKLWDASNRIKPLEDMLAGVLDIDDSVFFKVTAEKLQCQNEIPQHVNAVISPFHPRHKESLLNQMT